MKEPITALGGKPKANPEHIAQSDTGIRHNEAILTITPGDDCAAILQLGGPGLSGHAKVRLRSETVDWMIDRLLTVTNR